jgi:hypothetical protein
VNFNLILLEEEVSMRMYDYQTLVGLKQQEVEQNTETAWKYFNNSQKQPLDETMESKKSLKKVIENLLRLLN